MLRYTTSILLIIISAFYCSTAFSQEEEHDHPHSLNEIGVSGGLLYCPNHKEWGAGMHVHYYRMLGLHSKWSLGGMFEKTWTDDDHFNVGIGAKYQITDNFNIGLLPGMTFLKHHDDTDYKSQFSIHIETVYDLFHWGKFHLGPVFDYSWTKNDAHFMLGVHTAYCF